METTCSMIQRSTWKVGTPVQSMLAGVLSLLSPVQECQQKNKWDWSCSEDGEQMRFMRTRSEMAKKIVFVSESTIFSLTTLQTIKFERQGLSIIAWLLMFSSFFSL